MSVSSDIDRLYENLAPGTRVQVADGREGTVVDTRKTLAGVTHDPRRQVLIKIGGRVKPFRKNDVKIIENALASPSKQENMYPMNEADEGQDLVKKASEGLPSPEKLKPTAGRVYWKDVKKSDTVIKLGQTFYVQSSDDCRYEIYWNGQEAVEAQTHLGTLVKNPELKESKEKGATVNVEYSSGGKNFSGVGVITEKHPNPAGGHTYVVKLTGEGMGGKRVTVPEQFVTESLEEELSNNPLPDNADEEGEDASDSVGLPVGLGVTEAEELPSPQGKWALDAYDTGLTWEISPGRSKLIIRADDKVRADLAETKTLRSSDSDGYAGFGVDDEETVMQAIIDNSDLTRVSPEDTGDLTDAPMLGIRDDGDQILERWAYMSYQVRSFLDDLMDEGEAVFISGGDESASSTDQGIESMQSQPTEESLKNPDLLPDPGPGMSPKYEDILPEEQRGEIEYKLPAYWASYLINGDASGLEPGEKEKIDAFLEKEGNPDIVGCGEQYFSWRNDATNLGGDVCDYVAMAPVSALTKSTTAHIPPTNTGGSSYKTIPPLEHRPVKEAIESDDDDLPDPLNAEDPEPPEGEDPFSQEQDSLASTWEEDRTGEYIQINPDGGAWYVAHGRAMEQIIDAEDAAEGDVFAAIRAWSDAHKVWYNVWSLTDHGNVELYDQSGKSYGGLV